MLHKVLLATSLSGVALLFLSVQPASAAACLRGKTVDSSGAGLSGVAITVTRIANNGSRSATSSSGGQFEVCGLDAGRYQVSAHKRSFQDSSRAAEVQANTDVSLTLVLPSKAAQMTAPQQTDAPATEPAISTVGMRLSF